MVFPQTGEKQMRSYVAKDGANPAKAITEMAHLLISSILASATSATDPGATAALVLPEDEEATGCDPDGQRGLKTSRRSPGSGTRRTLDRRRPRPAARNSAPPGQIAPTRPDTTVDGASLGQHRYRAVSLRGFGHWAKREPRQDAYLLRISANGQWLVGCVADGVSQPKYSHMAADIACREITRHIAAALDEQPAITDPDDWPKLAGNCRGSRPWSRRARQ